MADLGVIGWDIGGVNTKVARVELGAIVTALSHPFEVQRSPDSLASLLRDLAARVGMVVTDRHAVTMTAELSQMFRTKRDGVSFVLDAVTTAFPEADVHVFAVDGRFLLPDRARREPLAVAASNWAATATIVARTYTDAVLIDIGTTTTDIIPIVDGAIAAVGTTDPSRLATGELVYTGALRTPVEAIVQRVPVANASVGVSAESFSLIGDVHVWQGDLDPVDYSVATPDGRPATREFAGERIARVVCGDREMLGPSDIDTIASAIADAQVELIGRALRQVRQRNPLLRTAVVAGLGSFIAERVAHRARLDVIPLADTVGDEASRSAPAVAVALLLDEGHVTKTTNQPRTPNAADGSIDTVFKIGGSLLDDPTQLDAVVATIVSIGSASRIVLVPGGGPFANAVRQADRHVSLSDETAHWMAVLAMDQYAHLLAGRHPDLELARSEVDVQVAHAAGKVPIVAPYEWLRQRDPLPHSWDVTSDSISAWFASELGARHLVLVKPPGVNTSTAVDPYFASALAPTVTVSIVPADTLAPGRVALSRSIS